LLYDIAWLILFGMLCPLPQGCAFDREKVRRDEDANPVNKPALDNGKFGIVNAGLLCLAKGVKEDRKLVPDDVTEGDLAA